MHNVIRSTRVFVSKRQRAGVVRAEERVRWLVVVVLVLVVIDSTAGGSSSVGNGGCETRGGKGRGWSKDYLFRSSASISHLSREPPPPLGDSVFPKLGQPNDVLSAISRMVAPA
uniref:Uncharacterized protein n=1 Tax=Vespula pensylvanica TaxID=30213 RepID=A0A834P3X0_VESPE|nr:hypothetical protein H0235_006979 [Vespula pensylvanica]